MHIHICTQDLPTEYRWNPEQPVRGTEEFYVETARHLALLGHHVTVACNGPRVSAKGATFVPNNLVQKADILLDCNARAPYNRRGLDASRRVAWTNFVDAKAEQYSGYDALVCISQTHRKMLGGGIVVPHGVDRKRYVPLEKERTAIYTSSMDRGGKLLYANRRYIESKAGALLFFSRYPTGGGHKCLYPPLSEDEMAVLYGHAKWWIHPGMGVELFCISAAKAQVAGCLPIVRPTMALDETVRCGYKIRTDHENTFIQAVIDIMNGSTNPNAHFIGAPESSLAHLWSWEEATAQLAEVLMCDYRCNQP
jgi:hypothetical protein